MSVQSALIFGKTEYATKVAENISHKYKDIHLFSLKEERNQEDVELFDLSDNWDDLQERFEMDKTVVFCALEDDASNIFLTISLRATFSKLIIVAIATDKESANKLILAGANKVIPLVQTTAGIIVNMLEKPIITQVLHSILYEKGDLKVAQVQVENKELFEGQFPADIDWSKEYGVIVVSVIHTDMSSQFIYSAKSKHHEIENGDIFVVVGYDEDIEKLENSIGSRCNVDWSDWSR